MFIEFWLPHHPVQFSPRSGPGCLSLTVQSYGLYGGDQGVGGFIRKWVVELFRDEQNS